MTAQKIDKTISISLSSSSSLVFLDGLRGLAAFYVMVSHARWVLWEGYSKGYVLHPENYSIFEKFLVYFLSLFRYGYQAVLFFFVLSGFVIHLRYARKLKESPEKAVFDFWPYFIRRSRRLYPPLLFSIAVTFLLDLLGARLGYGHLYQLPYFMNSPYIVAPSYSLTTFFHNIVFVMEAYGPVWGSNGPLWSLQYEWWFYMFYPLFWFLSKRSIFFASSLMFALFLIGKLCAIWPEPLLKNIFSLMIVWWFGVLLADIYAGRFSVKFKYLAPLIFLLPFSLAGLFPAFILEIFWGLIFSGVISFCFYLQEKGSGLKLLVFLKPLGDMSYTLYVTHFPILLLMSGWLISRSPGQQSLPSGFGCFFFGVLICLAIAYLGHFVIEKPFITKRR